MKFCAGFGACSNVRAADINRQLRSGYEPRRFESPLGLYWKGISLSECALNEPCSLGLRGPPFGGT